MCSLSVELVQTTFFHGYIHQSIFAQVPPPERTCEHWQSLEVDLRLSFWVQDLPNFLEVMWGGVGHGGHANKQGSPPLPQQRRSWERVQPAQMPDSSHTQGQVQGKTFLFHVSQRFLNPWDVPICPQDSAFLFSLQGQLAYGLMFVCHTLIKQGPGEETISDRSLTGACFLGLELSRHKLLDKEANIGVLEHKWMLKVQIRP